MLKTVKRGMQSKVIKASETENEVVNSGLKGQWKRYGRG